MDVGTERADWIPAHNCVPSARGGRRFRRRDVPLAVEHWETQEYDQSEMATSGDLVALQTV